MPRDERQTSGVTVRFSRPRDDAEGPVLGPLEWVQVTYGELRAAPDGEPFAYFGKDQEWHIHAVHVVSTRSEEEHGQ